MANPQPENGTVRIATEILEALCRIRINGEARQVLDVIIRKTWGYNKTRDIISLSQFVKASGLKKPTVGKAIQKLRAMNIITQINRTQKDNDIGNSYSICKDYSQWKPIPKKIMGVYRINRTQKDNESIPKKSTTIDNYTKDINKDDLSPLPPTRDFEIIRTAWNDCAKRNDLPQINEITNTRMGKLKRREKEKKFNLAKIIDKIDQASHGTHRSNNEWRFNFDWILEPKNYIKILEGSYDAKQSTKQCGVNQSEFEAVMRKYGAKPDIASDYPN